MSTGLGMSHRLKVLDSIPDFQIIGTTLDQWNDWLARFKVDVRSLDFENLPDDKKVSILLFKLKDLYSTNLDVNVETIVYAELLSKITDYYLPVNLRQQFFGRRQRPDESFKIFARCLKALSVPCQFKDQQDSLVRDIFILNMHESYSEIAKIMRSRNNPTLDETVILADVLNDPSSMNGTKPGFLVHPREGVVFGYNNGTCKPIEQTVIRDLSHFYEEQIKMAKDGSYSKDYANIRRDSTGSRSQNTGSRKPSISIDGDQFSEPFNPPKYLPDRKIHDSIISPTVPTLKPEQTKPSDAVQSLANFKRSSDALNQESTSQPIRGAVPKTTGSNFEKQHGRNQTQQYPPLSAGECCSVSVTFKANTGNLFVCRSDDLDDLLKLKEAMNEFYASQRNRRSLVDAKPGMTCATFFEGSYYRAKIRSIDSENQKTTVMLLDLGNELIINNSEAMFTPKQFFAAPRRTFVIRVENTTDIKVHDMLDIEVVREERGFLVCDVKGHSDGPEPKARKSSLTDLEPRFVKPNTVPVNTQAQNHSRECTPSSIHEKQSSLASQPPIPVNQYVAVQVIYISPQGQVFVCPSLSVDEMTEICSKVDKWMSEPQNQEVLKIRAQGAFCASLFSGSWYRAKIVSVDRQNQIVTVQYYDFGNMEIIRDLTRLMVLPPKFARAPCFTFPVKPPVSLTVEENDVLEVMLLHEGNDGTWSVRVKGIPDEIAPSEAVVSTRTENGTMKTTEAGSTDTALNGPLKTSHPPISPNEFAKVLIFYKSPDGKVFAVPENQLEILNRMMQYLFEAEKKPLAQVLKGALCIAPYQAEGSVVEWHRAKVIRINRTGNKAKVMYIDVGQDEILPVSQLMVLPGEYRDLPPLAFEIKVPERVNVEMGEHLTIKLSSQDEEGAWMVQIKDESQSKPTTSPSQPFTSPSEPAIIPSEPAIIPSEPVISPSKPATIPSDTIDAPKESARPVPPIPECTSTMARVVYKGPEGVFATACDKLDSVANIIIQIGQLDMHALQSKPVIGDLYIAPFLGVYYRAQLQSVEGSACRVAFIDFGNELDLSIEQLVQLPPELASDVFTFKLPDGVIAEEGTDLKVRPVFLEDKGCWTILVEGQLGAGDDESMTAPHNVPLPPDSWCSPSLESDVSLPPTLPTIPFLPADSFTLVRILYVGTEGAFAAPVGKLEALQTLLLQISQMEHRLLQSPPVVNGLYVAPFDGGLYRARVLSIEQPSCHVVFVDYGNESDVPIERLMELSPELNSDIFTFKIAVDANSRIVLHEGFECNVKPISLEPNGSCLVDVNENHGNPQ